VLYFAIGDGLASTGMYSFRHENRESGVSKGVRQRKNQLEADKISGLSRACLRKSRRFSKVGHN
jgi:hypothetical protein